MGLSVVMIVSILVVDVPFVLILCLCVCQWDPKTGDNGKFSFNFVPRVHDVDCKLIE